LIIALLLASTTWIRVAKYHPFIDSSQKRHRFVRPPARRLHAPAIDDQRQVKNLTPDAWAKDQQRAALRATA
jgi:hypothetical protein